MRPQEQAEAIRAAIARDELRRVLVVRVARAGDTLAVLPALELLRAALPRAELVFLASAYAAPLLDAPPLGVNRVAAWPRRGHGLRAWLRRREAAAALRALGPFDLWLGLEDKPWGRRLAARLGVSYLWARSGVDEGHLVARKAGVLRPLGLWERGPIPWVRLAPDPGAAAAARERLRALPAPRIGLQCGSYGARHWRRGRRDPRPEWVAALGIVAARALGGSLVLHAGLGGREARAAQTVARALRQAGAPHLLLGDLDLPGLQAHLAGLDALVSANTGPAHLAAAAGTPVVLLEGPSTPLARPWCDPMRLQVVRLGLGCSPCRGTRHGRLCQVPRCLDELPLDAVLEALRGALAAGALTAPAAPPPGTAPA